MKILSKISSLKMAILVYLTIGLLNYEYGMHDAMIFVFEFLAGIAIYKLFMNY